jgi:hypothetical protein
LQPLCSGLRDRRLLTISRVERLKISSNTRLDIAHAPFELGVREVAVAMVHRLELATVDRNDYFSEEVQTLAQHYELTANIANRFAVVSPEPSYGFEVGRKPTREPHKFDVSLRLAFKTTTGLNAIKIAVDIDLKHHLRMVRRPTGRRRLNAIEPESIKIKFIYKDIDYAHWIRVRHVIIKCFGQQKALVTIVASNEPLHFAHSPSVA